jgi:NAD(P)H-dependent flavin oxidoreductase YrpB (nitropropane dioxygenase family)
METFHTPRPATQLPEIIQGGMGVHVSNHRLARTVARAGQLGVVSGTGLDTVYARLLQDGDPGARWAVERFPDRAAAERVLARHYKPNGREGKPYRNPPKWIIEPPNERQAKRLAELQELAVIAAYAEVLRAKHNHDGPIGINVLRKIGVPIPATLYGAMLAGVDVVITGAGSPDEMPALLDALANHEEGALKVKVLRAAADAEHATRFGPASLAGLPHDVPLKRPHFLAIVASVALAEGLAADPRTRPDGFIVEGPTAGGHNAPPRGPWRPQTDPAYDGRDAVDSDAIVAVGLPFWLAGSYGSPDGLRAAQAAGARGIQAGTVFALSRESGLEPTLKAEVLEELAAGTLQVRTDGSVSPTGFPFKVHELEGTLSDPAVLEARTRKCDLGFLRTPVATEDGLEYLCPAEPVPTLRHKGGREQHAAGRVCLCNALFAAAGLPQRRHDGYVEPAIFTGGADLATVEQLSPTGAGYSAVDAIALICQGADQSAGMMIQKAA